MTGHLSAGKPDDEAILCDALAAITKIPAVPPSYYMGATAPTPPGPMWQARIDRSEMPPITADQIDRLKTLSHVNSLAKIEQEGDPFALAAVAAATGWPLMVAVGKDGFPADSWCVAPNGHELDHMGFCGPGSGKERAERNGLQVRQVSESSMGDADDHDSYRAFLNFHWAAINRQTNSVPPESAFSP